MSVAILANLEEDLGINIIDHFDLIAGTSTGGIIALALANGLKPREIVEFYLKHGPSIFKTSRRPLKEYFSRKFSNKPLAEALKDCFRDHRIADLKKRVVIPSYSLTADDVYVIRTPHHERLKKDYKIALWKVALATSSAPTFFPSCTDIGNARLIDGGVWANNPSMVALVEATGTLNIPIEKIAICSLGTTDEVSEKPRSLTQGGLWQWRKEGIKVLLRGQSLGAANQAKFLLGKERFERIDPKVAHGIFSLDGVSRVEDLIGKAEHQSRHFSHTFKDKFCAHRAHPYTPLYS